MGVIYAYEKSQIHKPSSVKEMTEFTAASMSTIFEFPNPLTFVKQNFILKSPKPKQPCLFFPEANKYPSNEIAKLNLYVTYVFVCYCLGVVVGQYKLF